MDDKATDQSKPTGAKVDDILNGLDDDLKPVEKGKDESSKETPKETGTAKNEEASETGTKDTPPKGEPKQDDKEDTEGYTADEIEDEPIEEEKPEVKEDPKPSGLSDEQQYILDNLKSFQVADKNGKVFTVKTPNELPRDFEFASDKDRIDFTTAVNAQELNARDLQQKYQQQQQAKQAEDYNAKETAAVRQDIAELQKDGELPKFKLKPDEKGFEDDPASKEVQNVLDYMEETNKQYLKEYEQGRTYRHIGFKEAYKLWRIDNPKKSPQQQQEDTERKEVAKKVGASQGLTSDKLQKARAYSGMRTSDLLANIDSLDW